MEEEDEATAVEEEEERQLRKKCPMVEEIEKGRFVSGPILTPC